MADMNHQSPEYTEYPIPEFRGNPLIEALRPIPEDDDEIFRRLAKIPEFTESELSLPPMLRSLLPQRLGHFMFPMAQHIRVYKSIYAQIIDGYRYRNPLTTEGQSILHHAEHACRPHFNKTSTISFCTGISGIGKTTLVNAIAESFGSPVIRHSNYQGNPFTETQITYLKGNAPDQCSPKSLCATLGELVDSMLGTNHGARLFSQKSNRTQHVITLRKMLENYHVGLLIIDAFENISLARAGGKEELSALIGNLRDGLGVPILLVGTYRAAQILDNNMSTARRFSEGGYHELQKPSSPGDDDWVEFCKVLWSYQWLRKPVNLTEEIRDTLYDCSQGITGIVLTLFIKAQIAAIDSGTEVVNAKMLKSVYRNNLQPIHDMVNALRSGDIKALSRYEDLYRSSTSAMKQNSESNRFQELQKLATQSSDSKTPVVQATEANVGKPAVLVKRSVAELKQLVIG